MTPTLSDPVALEDRLEDLKDWLMSMRPYDHLDAIDLHLATLDDAVEALRFDKV